MLVLTLFLRKTLSCPSLQLWDVTDDQEAVDLVLEERDPQVASDMLLKHALNNFSTDNTSVMVIRFRADS